MDDEMPCFLDWALDFPDTFLLWSSLLRGEARPHSSPWMSLAMMVAVGRVSKGDESLMGCTSPGCSSVLIDTMKGDGWKFDGFLLDTDKESMKEGGYQKRRRAGGAGLYVGHPTTTPRHPPDYLSSSSSSRLPVLH